MRKIEMARETNAIVAQYYSMLNMPPEEAQVYLEDIRARVDEMGFDLGELIEAGLMRLGGISDAVMAAAVKEPKPYSNVDSASWPMAIEYELRWSADWMTWSQRTFLQRMLCDPFVTAHEMARIEAIISNVRKEQRLQGEEDARALTEAKAAENVPPSTSQFNFDD
jgi:hypothetical protein